jgi:hypothetical protein
VFLIDQPGAVQANLFAGQVVAPSSAASSTRFDIANGVIGGDFTSRLNMNLREDKHWSYGARSSAINSVGQRPWMASAPVQIDKTGPAMAEMRKEIAAFADGSKPATAAEVNRIRNIQTLSLPGAYETASAVASTIGSIVQFKRPDDYVLRRKAEIEAMTPAQVQQAAAEIKPQALTWVVVGDLKQTEAAVRALNLGEVTVIDAEGNPVKKGRLPASGQAGPGSAGRWPATPSDPGPAPGIRPPGYPRFRLFRQNPPYPSRICPCAFCCFPPCCSPSPPVPGCRSNRPARRPACCRQAGSGRLHRQGRGGGHREEQGRLLQPQPAARAGRAGNPGPQRGPECRRQCRAGRRGPADGSQRFAAFQCPPR